MSSDSQVQQVKQKADIVAIIGERVNLKKAGRNFKGLCPFHGEKSSSFFVSAEMQMYKCFGCGVAGDVLSFLMAFEGLTFPEALDQLARRVGVTLTRSYRTPEDSRRERLLELLHLAGEFYQYLLLEHPVGKKALAYLERRGVQKQSIKDFQVGYAPDKWSTLTDYLLKKKGYKAEELTAVGLTVSGPKSHYDRFRGRVMFPLKTYAGAVVGFSGRLLDPEAKEVKYINSPETTLYHKGELLFGLSFTKQYVRQKDRVVVVEGEMDVVGSYQAGLKEVVAIKGSALTEAQVLQLRRLTHNIVLALDADSAGQEAMRRGIEVAEKLGVNLRVVRLSGGKDPDELARADAGAWKAMVESAVSVYQFFIDWAFEKYDGNSGLGQKQISQFLAPLLRRIENAVERTYYTKMLSERLDVPERVVLEEVEKARIPATDKAEEKEERGAKMPLKEKMERYVMAVFLQLDSTFREKLTTLSLEWFGEEYLKRLITALQTAAAQPGRLTKLVPTLPEEQQAVVRQLYAEDLELLEQTEEELSGVFDKAYRRLQEAGGRQQLVTLSQTLAKTTDATETGRLQEEYRKVSKRLSE